MNKLDSKIINYFKLMRLHQPIGIMLLLIPCLWSIAITGKNILNFRLLNIFMLGSIITRSLGCIINDIIDVEIDSRVVRTKNRFLASGKIKIKEAIFLIFILSIIALILVFNLNKASIKIAFVAPILIICYPFMKRITYFPQLFLGITFNLGVLMASCAIKGKIEAPNLMLYIAAIFWTLGYDTIYAHQDKYCDIKIGVKSTALVFFKYQKEFIILCYLVSILFIILSGVMAKLNPIFYYLILSVIIWFILEIVRLDLNSASSCAKNFKLNQTFGLLILSSILIANPILLYK